MGDEVENNGIIITVTLIPVTYTKLDDAQPKQNKQGAFNLEVEASPADIEVHDGISGIGYFALFALISHSLRSRLDHLTQNKNTAQMEALMVPKNSTFGRTSIFGNPPSRSTLNQSPPSLSSFGSTECVQKSK